MIRPDLKVYLPDLTTKKMATSCNDVDRDTTKSGGIFDINIPGIGVSEVYCDLETDGGNWTVSEAIIYIVMLVFQLDSIYDAFNIL